MLPAPFLFQLSGYFRKQRVFSSPNRDSESKKEPYRKEQQYHPSLFFVILFSLANLGFRLHIGSRIPIWVSMLTPLKKGWFFSPRKEEANGDLSKKGKEIGEGDRETIQGQNSGGVDGVEEVLVNKKERESLVVKIVKLETEVSR